MRVRPLISAGVGRGAAGRGVAAASRLLLVLAASAALACGSVSGSGHRGGGDAPGSLEPREVSSAPALPEAPEAPGAPGAEAAPAASGSSRAPGSPVAPEAGEAPEAGAAPAPPEPRSPSESPPAPGAPSTPEVPEAPETAAVRHPSRTAASSSDPLPAAARRLPAGAAGVPARSLPEEVASQYWDITTGFDSGHLLFMRFVITNLGLGDRNAAAVGVLVAPDGRVERFDNGRREGRWSLSEDGLRLEVGSSLFDQHAPLHRIRVDKSDVRIDLVLAVTAREGGELIRAGDHGVRLVSAAAPAGGSLWVEGMPQPIEVRGTAALTHTWAQTLETNVEQRRIEFFSLRPDAPVYLLHVTSPSGDGRAWTAVSVAGGAALTSRHVDLCGAREAAEGYRLPESIRIHAEGSGIEGRIQVSGALTRYDPFDDLPAPFRWALSVLMRPLRVWARSPFQIALRSESGEARHFQGVGVTNASFLNPLEGSGAMTAAAGGAPCGSA